jgi:hypothetical protein
MRLTVVVADAFAVEEPEEIEVKGVHVVNSPGPRAPLLVVMFT